MAPSNHGNSSSSSNRTSADEEHEDAILMGEYKGSSATSEVDLDEGYDFDKSRSQRRRLLRARSQLSRTLRIGKLQSIIQSILSQPKVQNALNSVISAPKREALQHHLIAFLVFLLPTFVRQPPNSPPRKLSKMAYLDGLRGVAALFVMIHHYACQFTPALLEGWGSDPENSWILQLPFIRVIHSGSFMVVLFFVISGTVLSYRSLKLARDRKKPEFTSSLASSVFRRWIRLHLPVIASMCVAFVISRSEGWTHLSHDWLAPPGTAVSNTSILHSNLTVLTPAPLKNITIVEESPAMLHLLTRSPILEPRASNTTKPTKFRLVWDWTGAKKNESLSFQIWDFTWGVIDVCEPFRGGGVPGLQSAGYNSGMILWTIPSEWLGSIVVFVVVLGIAWTRTWLKLSILGFMVCWCHYGAKWSLATFLSGVFIAELTLIRDSQQAAQNHLPSANDELPAMADEKESETGPLTKISALLAPHKQQITATSWIILFLTGIYIGAIPLIAWSTTPGFITLRSLIPDWYFAKDLFYPCLGSVFMMLAITYSPHLQKSFERTFPQYLGRISFSLYLLHTQILTTLGIRVFTAAMRFVGGGEGQVGFAMGMAMGGAVMFPFTFWAADVFTRAVDERSVEFARRVAGKTLLLGE